MSRIRFGSQIPRRRRRQRAAATVIALISTAATLATGAAAARAQAQEPCDIYAAGGTPCVAAHSTTRALYGAYDGALYQVRRASDGTTKDIGVLSPGGYADANAQDAFCAGTICFITIIYDQSPQHNDLTQAPPGTFKGPAPGQYDNPAIADMAPASVDGHKVYGVYIMPGMGYRDDNATGIATDDQAEGIYALVDGTHYDSGCCFDYGNASRTGKAEGIATMETFYFGTATAWTTGAGPGPWLMSDLEAGLYSGGQSNGHSNPNSPTITDRFVTGFIGGYSGDRFSIRKGNGQTGPLTTFYDGPRPSGYTPMHKQGAVLLGTGGDNGDGSSGTFYEGVMTSGTPSDAVSDAVQDNIVSTKYNPAQLTQSPVTTFTQSATQNVSASYTNYTGHTMTNVALAMSAPSGWTATASGSSTFASVAPGQTVTSTFRVRSSASTGAGYLNATATGSNPDGSTGSVASTQWARDVFPIKLNEFRTGVTGGATDSFVELYNASTSSTPIDISNWTIAYTPTGSDTVTLATIPAGTTLARGSFYLLTGPGYTGAATPNQTYVATLSATAGALALQDATGVLTDGLNYGSQQSSSSGNGYIVSPVIARTEGGTAQGGCIAVQPSATAGLGRSLIRTPNGTDTDSNCNDFKPSTLPTPGAVNASAVSATTSPGASVASTLALALGAAPSFGALALGVNKDYLASMTATVSSTAGNGQLWVADPSATAPGHLTNGTFALPSVLQVNASSPAGTGSGLADVGSATNPTPLLTYAGPVTADPVTLVFQQHIGATDVLRSGTYTKSITFTLSTTQP